MGKKIIESKLCSETTVKDFCTADYDEVLSPLLDDAEIIKEVCQKTFEISDSDTNENNETFEIISPAMEISLLYTVRKFLVLQNVYVNKTVEKIDSIDKMIVRCASKKKQQNLINSWIIKM